MAGDDAYSSALVVYDAISTAHRTGAMNAKSSYDKLKARFESPRLCRADIDPKSIIIQGSD